MNDMEGDQEEGGDSGGGVRCLLAWCWWTYWHGLADATKRGRCFFSHRQRCAAVETGRGRAAYPAAQFPCYLSHCFFPPAHSPAGAEQHKRFWRSVKPPKTWPLVRGLLPLTNSYTTTKLFNHQQIQTCSHCVSSIAAVCTHRLYRGLNLLLDSQATQESSWHWARRQADTPSTSDTAAIF